MNRINLSVQTTSLCRGLEGFPAIRSSSWAARRTATATTIGSSRGFFSTSSRFNAAAYSPLTSSLFFHNSRQHQSRQFASYEGRSIADEELIKQSDDWAIEETNFCLGRFPQHNYYPETSDIARRTLMLVEGQTSRMFTRIRDGTVIPFMGQTPQTVYDMPDTMWNYFESIIIKHCWDETYEDAWEEEEPEFEEGELPKSPGEEQEYRPPLEFSESDLVRRASGAS